MIFFNLIFLFDCYYLLSLFDFIIAFILLFDILFDILLFDFNYY